MALAELMSWIPKEKRWQKKYRGRRYAVSPRQLLTDATKEASRTRANEWWTLKQAEIDKQLGKAKQHPASVVNRYNLAIRNHQVYAWWQRREGNLEDAVKSEQAVEWLTAALQSDEPPKITHWDFDPAWEEKKECGIVAITMWVERLAEWEREQQATTAAPKSDTIRGHIDDFMATRLAQAEATGKIGSYETQRQRLAIFRSWVEPLATIDHLNETLWERFCLHLAKQVKERKVAPATMRGTQVAVRSFSRGSPWR
jgi:hypothetical protein